MCRNLKALSLCCLVGVLLVFSTSAFGQIRTITGTVYSSYELVADSGDVYEVIADEKGEELTALDGSRVSVTGIVEELDGFFAITVSSFRVLEDTLPEEEPEEEPYLDEEPGDEPYQEGEPLEEEPPLDDAQQ